jgi:tetratricopeptide (TPR) repeat protein
MRSRRGHGHDLYSRAEELNNLRDHERALPFAERAVADDPRSWKNWCSLARALNGLFRYGEALRAAERALALEPEAEWAHRLRALALQRIGRRSEALEAAREAVAIRPDNSWAWSMFAETAKHLGYEDEARPAAERAVALAPNNASHWVTLSYACLDLDWEAAAEACERALQLNSETEMALNNLGWVRLAQGAPQEARELFERAIRIAPGNTKFLFNRALTTSVLEGREAGTEEYLRVLELALANAERRIADNPQNASAHADRSAFLRRDGLNPAVALESAKRAVAIDPHLAYGWAVLMEAAGAAGRWKLGRYAARRAIEADPSTPARWINAAEVAVHAGRPDEARFWANRVVTEAPDSRSFLEAEELRCVAAGDFAKALMFARENVARSPLTCCRHVAIANCCFQLGDEGAAREALGQAEIVRPACGCFRRQAVERRLGIA